MPSKLIPDEEKKQIMFKFVNRKEKKTLVLIPGWAFDYRIFNTLNLDYNYIFFVNNSVMDFEVGLKELLRKKNIKRISLLGWSQGVFSICDFACKNPYIIDELILVSIKRKYDMKKLKKIKEYILRSKEAYLYKFYTECFSKEETEYLSWFKKELLKDYLKKMDTVNLIEDLDRLAKNEINPEYLSKIKKIRIIHGQKDKITPVEEGIKIKEKLPFAKLNIFENSGHLPFLRKNFKEFLND